MTIYYSIVVVHMQADMMSIIFVIFWIAIVTCDASPSLHHLITPEERMEIFGTDKPPAHEVVPVTFTKLHKRNIFNGDNAHIALKIMKPLYLECYAPSRKLAGKSTPIYHVHNTSNSVVITKNGTLSAVTFYENAPAAATFGVCNIAGRLSITGVIRSKRLALRPLPDNIIDRITKHRRSLHNSTSYENHQYHLVIKLPKSSKFIYNNINRIKRAVITKPAYPEIVVIVDNWLYQGLKDWLVPYVLSYWYAVDLIYRNLYEPEIILNIAAIYIAADENALNYMVPKIVDPIIDDPVYDIDSSLSEMGHWLLYTLSKSDHPQYDVAFTMTLADLYSGSDKSDGKSYLAGACTYDSITNTTKRVAVIKNDGAFDRIERGAYELAHLLGAKYENENPRCQFRLELAGNNREATPFWSNCILDSLKEYLSSYASNCLWNVPDPGNIIPIDVPGKIMSVDQQCQRLGYNGDTPKNNYVCQYLNCIAKNGSSVWFTMPATTGTPCGENKVCFNRTCIDE